MTDTLKQMDLVDSKFRFVHVAARRARQLMSGARPLKESASRKPTRVAQEEVMEGLIAFEIKMPAAKDVKVEE